MKTQVPRISNLRALAVFKSNAHSADWSVFGVCVYGEGRFLTIRTLIFIVTDSLRKMFKPKAKLK